MAEAQIPVDLFNPGQVFACLGFLEAADVLLGDAEGGFDWSSEANVLFNLRSGKDENPFSTVLQFFSNATVCSTSPQDGLNERDGGRTRVQEGVHPCRINDKNGKPRNALLPIELSQADKKLQLEYWADLNSGRPILRLWTATNGNSAFVRFMKLLDSFREASDASGELFEDPFNAPSTVAANFRLELRRNWTALGAGFSPDKQNKVSNCVPIDLSTYPVVELLAALGLTHARPLNKSETTWGYAAWADWLPPGLARVAVSRGFLRRNDRRFWMFLEKPNDGGDMSIAYATEDKETHT